MIWMEEEWAWYVFLWLFLLTELHTLEINSPNLNWMDKPPQRHWKVMKPIVQPIPKKPKPKPRRKRNPY